MLGNLSTWLTPVWILSAGVTVGAAALLVLYGILWLVARRAADAALRVVKESVLQWISYIVAAHVVFFFLAIPISQVSLGQLTHSLGRLTSVGTKEFSVQVPARTDDFEVAVGVHRRRAAAIYDSQRAGPHRRRRAGQGVFQSVDLV